MMIRLGNCGEVITPRNLKGEIMSANIERHITHCKLGSTYNNNDATITFTITYYDKDSYDIAKNLCLNARNELVIRFYNSIITINQWHPLEFTPNSSSYDIVIKGYNITVSERIPITIQGKDILLNPVTYHKMKDMINTPLEDLTLEEFNEYRTAIEM
jgi:hypothetical protein